MNVLFPENDNENNGELALDSENEGVSSDVDVVDSNAEMTPGNTSDEEYERKFSIIIHQLWNEKKLISILTLAILLVLFSSCIFKF